MELVGLSVLVLGTIGVLLYLQRRAGRASAATCRACHVQMVYLADVPVVSSRMGRQRSLAAMLFGDEEAALYRCPRCGHHEQLDY
jgi:hypothetical protein